MWASPRRQGSPMMCLMHIGEKKFGRFGWLLLSLLSLLALTPFVDIFGWKIPQSRMFSTVVLLAGMHSLRRDPWMFRVGFGLAFFALVAAWLTQQVDLPALIVADFLLTGAFFAMLTVLILSAILAERVVTFDTVLGGLCIYLLLGVLWVSLYSALEYSIPGSFALQGVAVSELQSDVQEVHRYPELLYFSYVTLTTLGYGDLSPKSSGAQLY